MGLGLLGRVTGTRPLNHRLGCRPADLREWVGCIPLKFSVSCDVLTAEIPPGGQIPPLLLPRAREPPVTCANPPGWPGLCHLPCPRKGHSSARVTLAGCPAPQNTPKPREITKPGQCRVHPTLLASSWKPEDSCGLRPPLSCRLPPDPRPPRARQLGTPLWPKAHRHHDEQPAPRLICRVLRGA